MIRKKFYKEIVEILNSHSRFEAHNFDIKTNKQNRNLSLVITYLHNSSFKFKMDLPSGKTTSKDEFSPSYKFSGTMSPGPFALEESFSFSGTNYLDEYINTWLNEIWEELKSNPVVAHIDSQRKEIDEIFERLDGSSEDFFTQDEAEELRARLDDLEKKFNEEFKKEIKDKEELKKEVSSLNKDIETLKVTLSSFNKKSWMKELVGKVFKWVKNPNNRKALKQGYSVVREILPEEYKGMLPEAKE